MRPSGLVVCSPAQGLSALAALPSSACTAEGEALTAPAADVGPCVSPSSSSSVCITRSGTLLLGACLSTLLYLLDGLTLLLIYNIPIA